jgi:hypothetical protein
MPLFQNSTHACCVWSDVTGLVRQGATQNLISLYQVTGKCVFIQIGSHIWMNSGAKLCKCNEYNIYFSHISSIRISGLWNHGTMTKHNTELLSLQPSICQTRNRPLQPQKYILYYCNRSYALLCHTIRYD